MIVLDTNIFYNFLFETELTDKTVRIFEIDEPLFTTFIIINESLYIISRKIVEKRFNISSYAKFREFISNKGYKVLANDLMKFFRVLDDLNITVLRDHQEPFEIWRTMEKYNLLPNDALIVATCKYYGIKKIATLTKTLGERISWKL